MTRAFGYVRLSKETEDTTSPDRQRQAIRRLCRERGWKLLEVFEDIDQSAFNGRHRPAFERMMHRLGETDAIVFWRLDRLSRDSREGADIAETCQQANVDLVATDTGQKFDTTSADGEFLYGLLMGLGRREVKLLSERTRGGVAAAVAKGHYTGRVPYGWRRQDKRLVSDRSQQAALRRAAQAFVRGGTYAEAANILGVAAPSVARRILDSPRVQEALGDLGDELATQIRSRHIDRVPASHRSLLGGIARCGECGGPMRRSSTRAGRGEGRWYAYRCATSGHAGIAGPWLEQYVTAQVLGAIDLRKLTKRIREHQRSPHAAEVAAIQARIEALEDLLADGTLDKAAFLRQRDRLNAKLAEMRKVSDDAPELPLELARRLPDVWPSLSLQARRRVIAAVVTTVTVNKATKVTQTIDPKRVALNWRT